MASSSKTPLLVNSQQNRIMAEAESASSGLSEPLIKISNITPNHATNVDSLLLQWLVYPQVQTFLKTELEKIDYESAQDYQLEVVDKLSETVKSLTFLDGNGSSNTLYDEDESDLDKDNISNIESSVPPLSPKRASNLLSTIKI
jgi:hypothetical protein